MSEKKPPVPDRLRELRDRLDAIDGAIVDAIAERQAVVAAIGELKQDTGSPLRHYAREREVIERGMARARELGVSERVARDILETLIHHSLGKQEQDKWLQSGHGEGRQALVIGGAGRMGDWMARYLDTVGYQVAISDPSERPSPFRRIGDWRERLDRWDLVVVAVPLRPSNDILLELATLRPPGLLFDIGSLKSPMREGLNAVHAAGCRVCSVHPMFGPDEIGLSGRHILFVDVGHADAVAEARALFAHTAADCVDLSLEEHDEVMAWVLGLSHLVNIAFASALAESGEEVPLLERISSSTFNAQLKVAAQVVSENPRLYYEIQQGNVRTTGVVDRFRRSLERLAEAVESGEEERFVQTMERANARLSQGRAPDAIG
ncbi:MAG: bifunctional chorismate mutase/prephenate dehydrogenase [Xanthomonadales bacterium]|jgi:chorismate mutase/prephenate dehydrogenase|nr:bifunctional chorismate mutase/prephenate dehydrogenase [Xanthomonadales bacterium]